MFSFSRYVRLFIQISHKLEFIVNTVAFDKKRKLWETNLANRLCFVTILFPVILLTPKYQLRKRGAVMDNHLGYANVSILKILYPQQTFKQALAIFGFKYKPLLFLKILNILQWNLWKRDFSEWIYSSAIWYWSSMHSTYVIYKYSRLKKCSLWTFYYI